MDVAIRGDPSSCLTQQLAADTYLFAVAKGFGTVDGEPAARAVLKRLRAEIERRCRGDRLRRCERRSRGVASSLLGAFSRVNEELHSRTASHEDYVTAACSVTSVLLVRDRAYLAHVGSTAAYLARSGSVVSLTKTDAFEAGNAAILSRALLSSSSVEVSACSFTLSDGDELRLLCAPRGTDTEQMLIVRYAAGAPKMRNALSPLRSHAIRRIVSGVLATIVFSALLCIR